MEQEVNKIYAPLFSTKARYVILMGGRGAGRSTVASQYAMAKVVSPEYFRCAIMRYVLGDIRNSIYREILDRADEKGALKALDVSDGPMVINYGENMINAVGFRKSSGEQKAKLKSLANYNCVIIEEADEIPEEDFMQLDDSLRTLKGDITIILLLNPPAKNHWIIKRWFDLEPIEGVKDFYIPKLKSEIKDTLFIRTSYEDNRANIAEQAVENYENYRLTKPAHYFNMVKGYVPEVVRGKIYSNWKEIDEVPHEARLERRGLDFGFSVDPTAIIDIYKYNGGIILDQRTYRKGLQNKPIADILISADEETGFALTVGDSAEPKSIAEIKDYGVQIVGVRKKAEEGSKESWKKWSIGVVQSQKISYTKRSTDLKKEYENYAWKIDKATGEPMNVPTGPDHALNAAEYGIVDIVSSGTADNEQETAERLLSRLKNKTAQTR